MAIIETKYSIGDTVFQARTEIVVKQHPCPDCKGSREWEAISPAGQKYGFSCPRCTARYMGNKDLSLNYSQYVPATQKLTIGSIQTNTCANSETKYMCHETGVGGGQVYNEEMLFQTEEDAIARATAIANIANAETKWVKKLYESSLDLSEYELIAAERRAADRRIHEAHDKISQFVEDLENCENEAEFKICLAKFKEARE